MWCCLRPALRIGLKFIVHRRQRKGWRNHWLIWRVRILWQRGYRARIIVSWCLIPKASGRSLGGMPSKNTFSIFHRKRRTRWVTAQWWCAGASREAGCGVDLRDRRRLDERNDDEPLSPGAATHCPKGLTQSDLKPGLTILVSLNNHYVNDGWLVNEGSKLESYGSTHGALDDINSVGIVLSNFKPTHDTSSDRVAGMFDDFPGLRNYRMEEKRSGNGLRKKNR